MLAIYTRHYPPCQQSDAKSQRCHCPKWIRGVLPDQGRVRLSARTRNWAEAKEKARTMERQSHRAYTERHFTVANAVRGYLDHQQAHGISLLSLQQSRSFLQRRFLRWCTNRGLRRLCELHAWQMREFCCTWSKATTALRWHERLRSFFVFCITNHWQAANPLDGMRKPRVRYPRPTEYFERGEFNAILEAARRYDYGGGHDCKYRAQRMHALVLLMRWSGLAIKDAVTLERQALDADGRLFLRRENGCAGVRSVAADGGFASAGVALVKSPVLLLERERQCTERCAMLRAQLSQTLSHRRSQESRWDAEALPRSYVPGYLRCRIAPGRRAHRSGIDAAGPSQRENDGKALFAVGQGEARSTHGQRDTFLVSGGHGCSLGRDRTIRQILSEDDLYSHKVRKVTVRLWRTHSQGYAMLHRC